MVEIERLVAVSPDTAVRSGDRIIFTAIEEQPPELKQIDFALEIHYEDEFLLVLYKPQGVVCHPSFGHWDESLVNYLLARTKLSDNPLRPGIVHRLDKDTSGLMVVAKNNLVHLKLTQAFAQRQVEKKYLTLCYGKAQQYCGQINLPIGRHPNNRKKQAITDKGKTALTNWQIIDHFNDFSLIECQIETGRTHQIRVHLHHIGLPVVGDTLYLSKKRNIACVLRDAINRLSGQLLHAHSLKFKHPIKQVELHFQRHVPKYFSQFIQLIQSTA